MLQLCFAFDHINYSHYLSFQQVYLHELKTQNTDAYKDLKEYCFGGSLSAKPHFILHGDLTTETFNEQTKHQASPHSAGFSRDLTKLIIGYTQHIVM